MLQTEFIRSMNCNYERILLDKRPEEKRYQYCILSRGGIRGLLPCSLRYLNGDSYLYYDITSRQSITQLYGKRCITRKWFQDFVWSLEQLQNELGRFLLDDRNVIWYPDQIFQDLEENSFDFLYIPYYEGESSFLQFLGYLVEKIDYEDEVLVECVYKMYEQCEQSGDIYLQTKIFEDVKILNREDDEEIQKTFAAEEKILQEASEGGGEEKKERSAAETLEPEETSLTKKGIRYLFDGRKRKNRNEREVYRRNMQLAMEGYGVAEEPLYRAETSESEEYGKTVYIEENKAVQEVIRRLYTPDGRIVMQLCEDSYVIGKKKEDTDLVLDDFSVSRMHARIYREVDGMYIEDLNSTNGTYKNGLRMQPYEKRKLEPGDEIKIGKIVLLYR